MTAPAVLSPNADLVSSKWLPLYSSIASAGLIVATTLPADNAKLQNPGAIRTVIVGGTPDTDVPVRHTVVTAQCWAAPIEGSKKLPWNQAAQYAEWCWEATYDRTLMNRAVTLLPGYAPARVFTVEAIGEPVRVSTDPNFARFDIDLLFHWIRGV